MPPITFIHGPLRRNAAGVWQIITHNQTKRFFQFVKTFNSFAFIIHTIHHINIKKIKLNLNVFASMIKLDIQLEYHFPSRSSPVLRSI